MAERDRWPLWAPVLLGAGISIYFAAPSEPWPWAGAVALFLSVIMLGALRRRPEWLLAAVAVALVAAGLAAAQLRAALVAAPVLERPSGQVRLTGSVAEVEPLAGGGQRVTFEKVQVAVDGPVPEKVRLRLKSDATLPVGAVVAVNAVLTPPPQPMMPGAYDFARHAWFQGLGAVGFSVGEPEIIAAGEGGGLNDLRRRITARIMAVLPGATGGVAAALVTGETAGIPRQVLDDYRDSGLAHILSISGLHMSLAASLVFFVVRGGLALWPRVALRQPIKKWAAVAALGATFFYMLLAGAPVPAQRSFLMTGIVLVAVLLDRLAISLRLVAWAAMVVLLLAPEALAGPSFQMSFAAVAALVAAYEHIAPRLNAWRSEHPGWGGAVALYLAGTVLSTLIAGSATAIYGAYHFNRFAVWSVVANAAAVPLSGLTMPFAAAGLLLMPLGLDHWPLMVMGWGVDATNWIAAQVAHWPAAAFTLPVMPLWGLVAFTLGGLWLLLWRGRWRLWGLAGMVLGLVSLALDRPPDLLVDSRGYAMGVRNADGALLISRGGRILRETWTRRAGPEARERWPKQGRSADGRLSCDKLGCLYRTESGPVELVLDDDGLAQACAEGDVVVSAVPIRQACRTPRLVVDRFDLWRRGAHAIWLDPLRVESVALWQGERPWSHKPHRRKKKPEEVPAEPPKVEDED